MHTYVHVIYDMTSLHDGQSTAVFIPTTDTGIFLVLFKLSVHVDEVHDVINISEIRPNKQR